MNHRPSRSATCRIARRGTGERRPRSDPSRPTRTPAICCPARAPRFARGTKSPAVASARCRLPASIPGCRSRQRPRSGAPANCRRSIRILRPALARRMRRVARERCRRHVGGRAPAIPLRSEMKRMSRPSRDHSAAGCSFPRTSVGTMRAAVEALDPDVGVARVRLAVDEFHGHLRSVRRERDGSRPAHRASAHRRECRARRALPRSVRRWSSCNPSCRAASRSGERNVRRAERSQPSPRQSSTGGPVNSRRLRVEARGHQRTVGGHPDEVTGGGVPCNDSLHHELHLLRARVRDHDAEVADGVADAPQTKKNSRSAGKRLGPSHPNLALQRIERIHDLATRSVGPDPRERVDAIEIDEAIVPHDAPPPETFSLTTTGGVPPAIGTSRTSNGLRLMYPIREPSGEKNGPVAPSVPLIGTASSASRERSHNWLPVLPGPT